MSWRVVATAMIAIFVILLLSVVTANPIHMATGSITELDGGEEGNGLNAESVADSGLRAYGNIILILSLGLVAWGTWYLLRKELSAGRL